MQYMSKWWEIGKSEFLWYFMRNNLKLWMKIQIIKNHMTNGHYHTEILFSIYQKLSNVRAQKRNVYVIWPHNRLSTVFLRKLFVFLIVKNIIWLIWCKKASASILKYSIKGMEFKQCVLMLISLTTLKWVEYEWE
jgi:hypothetical protein